MTTSIFLARILALTYLAAGLGSLVNKNHLQKVLEDYLKSPGVVYLGSLIALWLGYWMVAYHNVWAYNWTVIITVMGWGALLKGIIWLVFPDWAARVVGKFKIHNSGVITVLCLVLGLVLGYFGFVA